RQRSHWEHSVLDEPLRDGISSTMIWNMPCAERVRTRDCPDVLPRAVHRIGHRSAPVAPVDTRQPLRHRKAPQGLCGRREALTMWLYGDCAPAITRGAGS